MTLLSAIPTAQIILHLRVSLNGMSVLIPEYLIEAVCRLPAVKRSIPTPYGTPPPSAVRHSSVRIRRGNSWGAAHAGGGVIIGGLDPGIWPEQPSFADPEPSGKPYATANVQKKPFIALSRSMAYHAELQHAIAEMAIELDGIGPHIKRVAQDWSDRVD